MSATIRQEVIVQNALHGALTNNNEQCILDTTAYDGTVTYRFEIVAKVVSGTFVVNLQRNTGGTNDATINVTQTSYARQSLTFTPPAGATQYTINSTGGTTPSMLIARIVVIQTGNITKTQTQIELGPDVGGLTNTTAAPAAGSVKYWLYTAANWDGTVVFTAAVDWKATSTKGTITITLQEDDGAYGSWADKVTIVSAVSTTRTYSVSSSFTPTDGRHYRVAGKTSATTAAYDMVEAKVIATSTGMTKFETQYLLSTCNQNATGQGHYDSSWDTTEWFGVTNVYTHAIDTANSGDAAKLTVGGVDIASSGITGGAVTQTISGALTMPATGTLDTNVTAIGAGILSASRLIVATVINAVSGDPPFPLSQPSAHYTPQVIMI